MDEALHESEEIMMLWRETQKHPDVQPYSGGLMDTWPALAVDGLWVVRTEVARIRAYLQAEVSRG